LPLRKRSFILQIAKVKIKAFLFKI
jgi:hypothetical protein